MLPLHNFDYKNKGGQQYLLHARKKTIATRMPSIQVFIWPAKDTQHVQHHRESAERDKHTSQHT